MASQRPRAAPCSAGIAGTLYRRTGRVAEAACALTGHRSLSLHIGRYLVSRVLIDAFEFWICGTERIAVARYVLMQQAPVVHEAAWSSHLAGKCSDMHPLALEGRTAMMATRSSRCPLRQHVQAKVHIASLPLWVVDWVFPSRVVSRHWSTHLTRVVRVSLRLHSQRRCMAHAHK